MATPRIDWCERSAKAGAKKSWSAVGAPRCPSSEIRKQSARARARARPGRWYKARSASNLEAGTPQALIFPERTCYAKSMQRIAVIGGGIAGLTVALRRE